MATTLAEATARLALIQTAYDAALNGKSVSYLDRSVGYQDIEMLSAEMDKWQKTVDKLTAQAGGATNPGVRIATWT